MKRWYVIPLLLFAGCSNSTDAPEPPTESPSSAATVHAEPAPSASYDDALAAAVAAVEVAAQKRNAWSTSDALLKQAQAAATDGDELRAIQLADEARIQAELASEQAETESLAWRTRVLSD